MYKFYKIPNRVKNFINKDFLIAFKEKLDEIFETKDSLKSNILYYYNLESSNGFAEAFEYTCDNHIQKSNGIGLKRYYKSLVWYNRDQFDENIVDLMVKELGITKATDEDHKNYYGYNNPNEILYPEDKFNITWKYEIIQHKSCKHYKKVFINQNVELFSKN